MTSKKPTRRKLIAVIQAIRDKVEDAYGAFQNDRDPNRGIKIRAALLDAQQLCYRVQSHDLPVANRDGSA